MEHETNLISENLQYSEQINPKRSSEFEIEKSNQILKSLEKYLNNEKLLSASSLNTYITCPVKFYFKHIAQIKTLPKDNEFEIDALKFGNIFHSSMEKLYEPFIGKIIKKDDFKDIKKNIDIVVKNAVLKELSNSEKAAEEGINKITSNVIKKYIENFIALDIQYAPFKIVSLEHSIVYNGIFEIKVKNESKKIKILSIFDRVDFKNNRIRIIDYKTGNDDLSIRSIDELFDSNKIKNSKKAIFQMILYSIIYKRNNPSFSFEPLLLKTKTIKQDPNGNIKIANKKLDSNSVDVFDNFEINLKETLEELFNSQIPFSQTSNTNSCQYCDYSNICGKI